MDFSVSDEHMMIRETAAKIAGSYGHDYYMAESLSGGDASELWEAMAQAGFVGANTPEVYGGAGMGLSELAIMGEEMAAAGCPSPMSVISPAIVASILVRHASEELKQEFLPRMASGDIVLCFAITEPDAGSNAHEVSTTAVREADHYRLNGGKYYISGFDQAASVLVVARTGRDASSGRGRLSLFLVDSDADGLAAAEIDIQMHSPERQYTLSFDEVLVPAGRLVGEEGRGLQQVFAGLNPERVMGAAMCIGIARYALGKAVRYAKEREVWGRPIGAHQAVAHPLARSHIAVEQARLLVAKAAWLYDTDGDPVEAGAAANLAKMAAAEAAGEALDRAIQTHGGNGMATEYGLATLWGLTRTWRIAPISDQMVLNFVATSVLGLPKSY
ncbi:acyl-CoA dehydrogenase family protein [Nitriliruptor alkaliphilus]|uniref:acyl-CoA dehydrogenase family protein n=1 Tax=Nitriliruptor alkaliphilus TaxID=427918 RepID=UPI000697D835|nr:acyl-CoA dehydrogenase family protein [Nitriliruptor alkaliphilus]